MQTWSTIINGSTHSDALLPIFRAFDPIDYFTMGFEAS